MNFIHLILKENYRKIFYELIDREDDNDDIEVTKSLRTIEFHSKPNTYYHFTKIPNCSKAVTFGLPYNREWFLCRSRKKQLGLYYKKAEITSILKVILFDLCGLSVRNIDECIEDFDNRNLPYRRDLFTNFYKRLVKIPWFDEFSIHRLTVDVDGKYYTLKNVDNESNDDMNDIIVPEVEVECDKSFQNVLNDRLTLYIFYRYLQHLFGPEIPCIIQSPMKTVFNNIKFSFDFYKIVHKDKNHLFLDVCPTVNDFLVFQDFFKHINA